MQFLWSATLGRRTTKNYLEEQDNEDRASQTTHRTGTRQADSGAGGGQERKSEGLSHHDEPVPFIQLCESDVDCVPAAVSHARSRIPDLEFARSIREEG